MKKLFTIAAAVLASVSMFAAEPTYESSQWATQDEAEAALGTHNHVTLAQSGLSYANLGSNGSFYFIVNNQTLKYSDQKYVSIVADATYLIDSVSIWYCENGGNATNIAWVAWGEDVTPGEQTLAHGATEATTGAKNLDNAKWVTIDVHSFDVQTMYIARKVQGYKDASGVKINDFGNGQTFNILGFKVWLRKTCQDPELTVSEGGVGFVGDVINIAISSLNQSKPINPAVTVDGVAGVYGTDYTFSASTGLVQATPLRAGRFVITFTQASNDTYCDAVDSAIYVISAKTPVTSFTVAGPSTAHVGEQVTLIATNFDAAPTSVTWIDTDSGEAFHHGDTLTFTSDEAGEVYYDVRARNNFNNPDSEEDDYEVAVTGFVTFFVGNNVNLSDLKVNGATIEGFDATVFEYNLGEIGVYEVLSVEAIAADAPYATVAVVDNGQGVITVTVTAQDESTRDYVLNYTRAAATQLASISESTTWDFTKTGATEIKFTDDTPVRKGVTEFNYADVLSNPDASFNAAALNGIAEYAVREGKYFQGSQLKFQTTMSGTLEVVYSNTGNRAADQDLERILTVNGVKIGNGALRSDTDVTESNIAISAGEVVISSVLKSDESVQYIRVKKVAFTAKDATAIANTAVDAKAVKVVRDGQLIIVRDGVEYNALGAEVR